MLALATLPPAFSTGATSPTAGPTVLAARVVDSQLGYGLDNGHSFPIRQCGVAPIESAAQTANLTSWYHPWFPAVNATSLHLFVDTSSWDGGNVTLKLAVASSNSTTLFVQGMAAIDFPPDQMSWSFGEFPFVPAAAAIDACPPAYCRMAADSNQDGASGCAAAPTTMTRSVQVTPVQASVSIDVTPLLQNHAVLKVWTQQANLFEQNATVTRVHAYPAPALVSATASSRR